MTRRESEVQEALELLEPLGPVQARAMFGGWGLYHGGLMFGLYAQHQLYLKTDELSRPEFAAAGSEPFMYDPGKGREPVAMSYWTTPPDASDDAHALLPWARRAVEASRRAAAKKKPSKSKAKAAPSAKPSRSAKPARSTKPSRRG